LEDGGCGKNGRVAKKKRINFSVSRENTLEEGGGGGGVGGCRPNTILRIRPKARSKPKGIPDFLKTRLWEKIWGGEH